jgi:hypothetical protein
MLGPIQSDMMAVLSVGLGGEKVGGVEMRSLVGIKTRGCDQPLYALLPPSSSTSDAWKPVEHHPTLSTMMVLRLVGGIRMGPGISTPTARMYCKWATVSPLLELCTLSQ